MLNYILIVWQAGANAKIPDDAAHIGTGVTKK